MLVPGTTLRRGWIVFAAVLVAYGSVSAATTLSLSGLRTTLAEHEDFHQGLAAALHDPKVAAVLRRCPLLSLPNNKLIPDARWILDSVGQRNIVARSQARNDAERGSPQLERRLKAGSVAVYPLGSAVFVEADRRRRRRSPRPGPPEGLQAHLHEPLLRRICQLLSPPARAPTRGPPPEPAPRTARGRVRPS